MDPDEILSALATSGELPREAMIAAGERREEMIPLFLEMTDRLRRFGTETDDEGDLSAFLFVFYLLGEWGDTRAYRPLVALLRRDPGFLDALLGDGLTEGTGRIIAAVCDGDLQPIYGVIEDTAADEFVRCQMLDALVLLALQRPETRPEVVSYLEDFFTAEIDKPETLWGSWAFAVADLGLEHLTPQVREAFEKEWISPEEADFAFFKEQLRATMQGEGSSWRHGGHEAQPITSAVDELADWYSFSDEAKRDQTKLRVSPRPVTSPFSDTFERAAPKTGRNDPCPCGSGKKYKKCCLQ